MQSMIKGVIKPIEDGMKRFVNSVVKGITENSPITITAEVIVAAILGILGVISLLFMVARVAMEVFGTIALLGGVPITVFVEFLKPIVLGLVSVIGFVALGLEQFEIYSGDELPIPPIIEFWSKFLGYSSILGLLARNFISIGKIISGLRAGLGWRGNMGWGDASAALGLLGLIMAMFVLQLDLSTNKIIAVDILALIFTLGSWWISWQRKDEPSVAKWPFIRLMINSAALGFTIGFVSAHIFTGKWGVEI